MSRPYIEVLHVIGSFVAGGAERFVVELARECNRQGLTVAVLSLSSKHDCVGEVMCQLLERDGIPYYSGPTDLVRYKSVYWYMRKLFDIRPDIVHLHTPNTELAHYIAKKIYRKNHLLVRTIHSTIIPPNKWYWKAIRDNSADISVACSRSVKNRFSSSISGKLIAINNGVNFDWPIQTPEKRAYFRNKLKLADGEYHVLHIGRQDGNSLESLAKAQDILIDAWKMGELGATGARLHLLGSGNLAGELKALASSDNSINFHGVQDNIHEWLLASDCYVMPSRYEGLPISGIEAIGTGLFCIFSNIEPLMELDPPLVSWVSVNGVNELSEKLIEARKRAYDMKIDEVLTLGVRYRFGIQRTAKKYVDCYHGITERKFRLGDG